MTIRIKPSGVSGAAQAGSIQGAQGAEKTSATEALRGASAKGVEGIVAGLRSGQLSPTQAVEQMVNAAMQQGVVALQPGQREQIEKMVRATLESDPALAALVKDLERSS